MDFAGRFNLTKSPRYVHCENQITELQKALEIIEHKINYYEKALELGTEKNLRGRDKLPYAEEFCRNN